jgi:ABC-2 type transport system ATP-binding protein
MDNEIAVSIKNVSKDFKFSQNRVDSLKGLFVQPFQSTKNRKSEIQHALQDITFEVKRGEFFGIVGRNGSGKSTLLKIIAGIYQPTEGTAKVNGRLVPFIELGVGFNPELTGKENVYLNGALMGFSAKEIDAMYNDIVSFAELEEFMDQKLKNYSSGMQVRLAFSVATRAKAEVLLIDEVLAVGDADFQRKCFDYFKKLKKNKTTVIFVSHDMNAVREFCDRAILIDNNKMVEIGRTDYIARRYSELFIEIDQSVARTSKGDENRWGIGGVTTDGVKISTTKDRIKINYTINADIRIDKIIYGLHISGPDGQEITATNNTMIHQPPIEHLSPGMVYGVEWDIMNIFNDGTYAVSLTLVDGAGRVFDWYDSAGAFTIKRSDRSTTAVLPPMTVSTRLVR